MSKKVNIPGVGAINFPDSMSDQEVASAIKDRILPMHAVNTAVSTGLKAADLAQLGLATMNVPPEERMQVSPKDPGGAVPMGPISGLLYPMGMGISAVLNAATSMPGRGVGISPVLPFVPKNLTPETPIVNIPTIPAGRPVEEGIKAGLLASGSPTAAALSPIAVGLYNLGARTLSGFTTPSNIPLLAAGPTGKLGKVALGVLGAEQLTEAPGQVMDAYKVITSPTTSLAEKIETGGQPIVGAYLGQKMLRHAAAPPPVVPEPHPLDVPLAQATEAGRAPAGVANAITLRDLNATIRDLAEALQRNQIQRPPSVPPVEGTVLTPATTPATQTPEVLPSPPSSRVATWEERAKTLWDSFTESEARKKWVAPREDLAGLVWEQLAPQEKAASAKNIGVEVPEASPTPPPAPPTVVERMKQPGPISFEESKLLTLPPVGKITYESGQRPTGDNLILANRNPITGDVIASGQDIHATLREKYPTYTEPGYLDANERFVTRTKNAAEPAVVKPIGSTREAMQAVVRESNNEYAKAYAKAYLDSGDPTLVLYVLNNLQGWRGERARQVKQYLRSPEAKKGGEISDTQSQGRLPSGVPQGQEPRPIPQQGVGAETPPPSGVLQAPAVIWKPAIRATKPDGTQEVFSDKASHAFAAAQMLTKHPDESQRWQVESGWVNEQGDFRVGDKPTEGATGVGAAPKGVGEKQPSAVPVGPPIPGVKLPYGVRPPVQGLGESTEDFYKRRDAFRQAYPDWEWPEDYTGPRAPQREGEPPERFEVQKQEWELPFNQWWDRFGREKKGDKPWSRDMLIFSQQEESKGYYKNMLLRAYQEGKPVSADLLEDAGLHAQAKKQRAKGEGEPRTPPGISKLGGQIDYGPMREHTTNRMVQLIDTGIYTGKDLNIVSRELIQNMRDAYTRYPDVPRTMKEVVSPEDNFYAVVDQGKGMDAMTFLTKYLPPVTSGKEIGEGGGFGLAKGVVLGRPKNYVMQTVAVDSRDGKTYSITLRGSGEGWKKYAKDFIQGKLPPEASNPDFTHIRFNDELYADRRVTDDTPGTMFALTDSSFDYFTKTEGAYKVLHPTFETSSTLLSSDSARTAAMDVFNNPDKRTLLGLVTGLGDETTVHPKPFTQTYASISEKYFDIELVFDPKAPQKEDTGVTAHILSNGSYQFSREFSVGGWGDKAVVPKEMVLDIKSKVEADDPNYPFTMSRDSVKYEVEAALRDAFATAVKEAKNKVKGEYLAATQNKLVAPSGAQFVNFFREVDQGWVDRVDREVPLLGKLQSFVTTVFPRFNEILKGELEVQEKAGTGALWGPTSAKAVSEVEGATAGGLTTRHDVLGANIWNPSESRYETFINPFLIARKSLIISAATGEPVEQVMARMLVDTAAHEVTHNAVHDEGQYLSRALTFLQSSRAKAIREACGEIVRELYNTPKLEQQLEKLSSYSKELEDYDITTEVSIFTSGKERKDWTAKLGATSPGIAGQREGPPGTEADIRGRAGAGEGRVGGIVTPPGQGPKAPQAGGRQVHGVYMTGPDADLAVGVGLDKTTNLGEVVRNAAKHQGVSEAGRGLFDFLARRFGHVLDAQSVETSGRDARYVPEERRVKLGYGDPKQVGFETLLLEEAAHAATYWQFSYPRTDVEYKASELIKKLRVEGIAKGMTPREAKFFNETYPKLMAKHYEAEGQLPYEEFWKAFDDAGILRERDTLFYRLYDDNEFIGGLFAVPRFREFLESWEYQDRSGLGRFLDAVKELLHLKEDSAANAAFDALINVAEDRGGLEWRTDAVDTVALRAPQQPPPLAQMVRDINSREHLKKWGAYMSGWSLPKHVAVNEDLGNAAVRYGSSGLINQYYPRAAVTRVLGDDQSLRFRRELGAVIVQGQFEGLRQELLRQAAATTDPAAQAELMQRASNVFNIWNDPMSPFHSPAEYQAAAARPDIQAGVARHMNIVQPVAEQQHLGVGGQLRQGDPATGAFINMRAIMQGEPDPSTVEQRLYVTKRGDITAGLRQGSRFGKEFRGTGQNYVYDYRYLGERMLKGNAEQYNLRQYIDALKQAGMAFEERAGETYPGPKTAKGVKLERRTIELRGAGPGQTRHMVLWLHPELVSEFDGLRRTDSPQHRAAVGYMIDALNDIQVMGLTDALWHTRNGLSAISTAQGGIGGAVGDTLRKGVPGLGTVDAFGRTVYNMVRVLMDTPEVQQELAEVALAGSGRGVTVHRGFIGKAGTKLGGLIEGVLPSVAEHLKTGKYDPNFWSGKALNILDRSMRLALNQMYDNLVARGWSRDSMLDRREFINKMGQYNGQLMGRLAHFAREYGFGPFVVAGRNFNRLGAQRLMLSPGVRAASPYAFAKMRLVEALSLALTFTIIPGTINYLTTGSPWGRPGVKSGEIDLLTDDESGRPKVFDPQTVNLVRRGMAVTGISGLEQGYRQGLGGKETAQAIVESIVDAGTRPYAGPAVRAGVTAIAGRDPFGRPVSPDPYSLGKNVRAAAEQLNPMLASAAGAAESIPRTRRGEGETALERMLSITGKQLGQAYGVTSGRFPSFAERMTLRERQLGHPMTFDERLQATREIREEMSQQPPELQASRRGAERRLWHDFSVQDALRTSLPDEQQKWLEKNKLVLPAFSDEVKLARTRIPLEGPESEKIREVFARHYKDAIDVLMSDPSFEKETRAYRQTRLDRVLTRVRAVARREAKGVVVEEGALP